MTSARGGGREPEVWLVDLAECREALADLEARTSLLAATDEARWSSLKSDTARVERRTAHIALRVVIERFAGSSVRGVPYEVASSGKPALPAAFGVSFSLSHIEGAALIAVSAGGPVGVDLERARLVRVMGERRSAIERAGIEVAAGAGLPDEPQARFLTAWVRLEAIAKAEGSGIGAHLSVFLGRRPKHREKPGPRSLGALIARDLALPGNRGAPRRAAGDTGHAAHAPRGQHMQSTGALFAAVALPERVESPMVQRLPGTLAGLEALVF